MRNWGFTWDMTGDGITTISDVGAWVEWLFFYPGDFIFSLVIDRRLGRFFEIDPTIYGGWLSGILSGLVWILVWLMALGMLSERQDELTNKMEEDE